MIRFLDKLNLRPQERRLVVLAGAVIFVVLNLWFVWPHFSDYGRIQREINRAHATLERYQTELARIGEYTRRLEELEGQGAAGVLPEEQATLLISRIQMQAERSGLKHSTLTPSARTARGGSTVEFFEEQSLTLRLNPTGPEELIDFLEALATGDLVIRVRELDLRPDPSQTRLVGSIRLVASFQKQTPEPTVTRTPNTTARRSS
jgi:hypothetical protein